MITTIDAKDRIKIDMAPIRRELMREFLPPGKQPGNLTPEERERLGREMAQRMLGVVAGLQLGAAELKKQAEAAQREAEADARRQTDAAKTAPVTQSVHQQPAARSDGVAFRAHQGFTEAGDDEKEHGRFPAIVWT